MGIVGKLFLGAVEVASYTYAGYGAYQAYNRSQDKKRGRESEKLKVSPLEKVIQGTATGIAARTIRKGY